MKLTDRRIADLVRDAATSNKAWNELALAFASQVKWAIRSHDLTPLQQEEAARATWASLAEHLDELRDAGEVAQWLTTRTHTACLHVKRHSPLGRAEVEDPGLDNSSLGDTDLGAGHRTVHAPTATAARRRDPDRRHDPRTGPDRRHGPRLGSDRRHRPRLGADRHDQHAVVSGGDSPDTLAARLTRRELSPGLRELPDPV